MNAATVSRVAVDTRHVEAFRMVASQQRQLSIIDRPIDIHDGSDSRLRCLVRPSVVHEKSASRFADDCDLRNIHMVLRGVGLDPADSAVKILYGLRKTELGRHPVIDAEPRESRAGKHVEQRPHVGALAAFVESAAVYQDRRRKRTGSIRHVQVQQQRLPAGTAILNVLLIHRRAHQGSRSENRENENRDTHRRRLYQPARPLSFIIKGSPLICHIFDTTDSAPFCPPS